MSKKEFKIPEDQIVRLISHAGGCLATDRIVVDGAKVGYMYREVSQTEADTGWRFFAGDEDEDYMANKNLHGVYAVNTIANYSPDILEYLDTPPPCSFERISGTGKFRIVTD